MYNWCLLPLSTIFQLYCGSHFYLVVESQLIVENFRPSLTIFYHMCNSDLGSLKCNWLHRDICSNLIWWVQKTLLIIMMCLHHCKDLKLENSYESQLKMSSTHLDELQGSLFRFISFHFIQANIKHIHLNKKHHKNITLNKIIRFKNSAWLPWIPHKAINYNYINFQM